MKRNIFWHAIQQLTLAATATLLTGPMNTAHAGEVFDSGIEIDVVASRVVVEGIQGTSGSTKVLFFKKKKSSPTLEASLDIGHVTFGPNAHVQGLTYKERTIVDSLYIRGAKVRIGGGTFE